MAQKQVCDFCLSEAKGFFTRYETLPDGSHICKNCTSTILRYGLNREYDLFQKLIVAEPNMRDMMMNAWLESHDIEECLKKYYPEPDILLHEGETCINAVPAYNIVEADMLPNTETVLHIGDVTRREIHNIPSSENAPGSVRVNGMLYETEVALYFMSSAMVNCHKPGYMVKNPEDKERIIVSAPPREFIYHVDHADLFYLRESLYRKIQAIRTNKDQQLIYITNENEITVTPGIYRVNQNLKAGKYNVRTIDGKGLHVRDAFGTIMDYSENDSSIELTEGTYLEVTGEYRLEYLGNKDNE
ncbi:MAG: hypothetical protein IKD69_09535 [Solobacterium sp.]|nr:hypothetical protein [Solobacterium sp.]